MHVHPHTRNRTNQTPILNQISKRNPYFKVEKNGGEKAHRYSLVTKICTRSCASLVVTTTASVLFLFSCVCAVCGGRASHGVVRWSGTITRAPHDDERASTCMMHVCIHRRSRTHARTHLRTAEARGLEEPQLVLQQRAVGEGQEGLGQVVRQGVERLRAQVHVGEDDGLGAPQVSQWGWVHGDSAWFGWMHGIMLGLVWVGCMG